MGVKSTFDITRRNAETRYVELTVQNKAAKRRAKMEERIRSIGEPDELPSQTNDMMMNAFHHIDAFLRQEKWLNTAKVEAATMSNIDLEEALERANDEANDGEGYENYIIVPDN